MSDDLGYNQSELNNKNWIEVGDDLYLEIKTIERWKQLYLYRGTFLIKTAKLSDRVKKKLFMKSPNVVHYIFYQERANIIRTLYVYAT